VGGLLGENNNGDVKESYSTGEVTGTGDKVGGLVGYNDESTVINSSASGNVTGDLSVGGLVGENNQFNADIKSSHASGFVNGSGQVGGLLGTNEGGQTLNSSASGNVTASGNRVGGLVGINRNGEVRRSYATGDVVGDSTDVGGLVGENQQTVTNSYATGNVYGVENVGGLVGYNIFGGDITKSYATGTVDGFNKEGGLVGLNEETVRNSYWDVQNTEQSSSDGGTGLNTEQMIGEAATGNMTGFDFTTTWDTVINPDNYPVLSWQPEDDRRGNFPPVASFSYSPTSPNVSETVSFNASLSEDPDGDITGCSWDFGDGTTAKGKRVTHSYTGSANYTVTLTVIDDMGATNTETKTISVNGTSPAVATVRSEDVTIERVNEYGNSTVSIDAPRGLFGGDVTVSVNTSVARIENVTDGRDVDPDNPEVLFNATNLTDGSVTLKYTNIAGTNPVQNFKLAQVQFELLSQGTDTPIGLGTDNFVYYNGSQTVPYAGVELRQGNLTDAVFLEPLPVSGFEKPPQNIPVDRGGFDDTLIEDLDGDGDPTEISPTVRVFGDLIRDKSLGLTERQARRLNWNPSSPETEVTPGNMVTLFGEKIRAD
jgi:PKD repeat protein